MGLDILTIIGVAVWIQYFILAVVVLYIIFYSWKKLTNGLIEIVKGNTAIALLVGSVFVKIGQVVRLWVIHVLEGGADVEGAEGHFLSEELQLPEILIAVNIFELILGIALTIAVIYLALNIFNKLIKRFTKGISAFEELKKGNLAVAILMAGIVFSIPIEYGVPMSLHILTIIQVAVWIVKLVIFIVFEVVALYIIFYSLKKLTNGILEEKEIVKGSTAIALLVVSMFVTICRAAWLWVLVDNTLKDLLLRVEGRCFYCKPYEGIIAIVVSILGIVFTVAAIYLALGIFNKLTKGINKKISFFEKIEKGNLGVAILLAGIVLSIAKVIQLSLINILNFRTIIFESIFELIFGVLLTVVAICLMLNISNKLAKQFTTGMGAFEELKKGNFALVILMASIVLSIATVIQEFLIDISLWGLEGITFYSVFELLIPGILLTVAAVYLTLGIFNEHTKRTTGIDAFVELKKGNLALAILMAGIVLSIASFIQLKGFYGSIPAIVFIVAAFYLTLNIFNELIRRTTGIDAFVELKKGNLTVAILLAGIALSIAKVIQLSLINILNFRTMIESIFELIFGVLLAVVAICLMLNISNKLIKRTTGIGAFEELKKGNLAVAILMAGIVLSIANIIQFYVMDIAIEEAFIPIAIILAVVALYISFYSLKKLTFGVFEEKEIVKGNTAIALLVASVFVMMGSVFRVTGPFQLILGIVLAAAAIYLTLNIFNKLTRRTTGIGAFEELKKGNLGVAILMAGIVLSIANIIQVDLIIIAIYRLFFDAKGVIAIASIFQLLGIVLVVAAIYLALNIFNKLAKRITKGIGIFEKLERKGEMRRTVKMNNTISDIVQNEEQTINKALNQFQVVSNLWLRSLIAKLPYVLAFLLLLDWQIGPGIFARDTFRLTAVITAIIELLLFNTLFDKVRESLSTIRKRGIISQSSETQKVFMDFIQQFGATLNSKIAQIFFGIMVSVIGFLNTFPIRCLMSYGNSCYSNSNLFDWLFLHYFIRATILEIPFAFLIGLLAWRLMVIAFFIYRLGKEFTLNVLTYHNDGSGGLKPLGDLCLIIAFIILLPVILLSSWIVVGPLPGYETINILWSDWFKILLLGFCLGAALFFFWPLYSIHEQMKEHRLKIQNELDELNSKMSEILTNLRTKADTISPDDGTKLLEKFEFMGKIHQKSSSVPTWPFNLNIIVKFIAAEAVPILSLIGVTGPLVKILESLFSLLA